MAEQDAFSSCHPAVNFIYFGLVIVFSMFFMHPVCLALSLACAAGYSAYLSRGKAPGVPLAFLLPMMGMAALVNPLFNHRGVTVLTYLPGGNPLTLESIVYGLAAAGMLAAVVCWFRCYNAVMTSDKFIYLFGRVIPSLSLLLSMTLRFVPRFRTQLRTVTEAQRCIGRGVSEGPVVRRCKNAGAILSIMLTWSLENAVETADSMKSRGYGLPGRTAFSLYTLDDRDRDLLVWLLSCGFYILCGWCSGGLSWQYFPALRAGELTPLTVSFFAAYLALCLTPILLDVFAQRTWRRLEGRGSHA